MISMLVSQSHGMGLKLARTLADAEEARREACRAASRVSELLVGAVNGGIEEAFVNEKRIELEIRALMSTVLRYSRQASQWHSMSQALNSALKVRTASLVVVVVVSFDLV